MSRYDKVDTSDDGKVKAHTRFIPTRGYLFLGRKVVAVELPNGKVEVRYDQEGTLDGKTFASLSEFEKETYKK